METCINSSVLSGMRVIEVSAFVAAPSGGMTLAQMGAEVIRIDPPSGGLDARRWPVLNNSKAGRDISFFWAGLNKHKKSVAIDITKPEGKELAQQLIVEPRQEAGMLLTNMPAKGWLDYSNLQKQRSDLIQLTVQGDRHGGSAVDYTLNPRLGLPYLTGPTDFKGVVNHVLPAWDLVTGQMAALGILAAERFRTRNGVGNHVKLPLEDVALAVMSNLGFITEVEKGVERGRYGNDLFGAFGRDFITRDSIRVMVVGLTLKQWKNLVKACNRESEISSTADQLGKNFKLEGDRFDAREKIADILSAAIAAKSFVEISEVFDEYGVCWGKYQTVKELLETDPACSTENPLFQKIMQPNIGETLTPCTPLNFGTGRLPPQPAPSLGQHTESVLLDDLKISSSEFGHLKDSGLIATSEPY